VHKTVATPNRGGLAVAALVLVISYAPPAGVAEEATPAYKESDFLTNTRQLIFEGARAGEGYFSPDGTKMVFQSEREPGNPFYQIYLMDMTTGETRRISPGSGKTTCAFIRPGSADILFGSTHHDPRSEEYQQAELEFRASGKSRRYSWDYDPEMEVYVADGETGELVNLTQVRGYDAEASYSPDGKWIVLSSMRGAYDRELSAEEQKMLEINPSFFGEIYIMRADGSGQRRLTEAPGYDGGPFFSADGSKIVWRRFDEDGLIADVWTMNPDGSEQTQITDFGSMSWAPYFHPTGEYILFASNKLGFSNFEVFMVDAEGKKKPVQVTATDGFDGLPVPTPDGKGLVWTSNRHNGGQGNAQLFTARWNHDKAIEALAAAPARTDN
jgi:Tol biopolymer transport system component